MVLDFKECLYAEYAKYRDHALQAVAKENKGSLNDVTRKYQQKYKENAKQVLDNEAAMDEIVADYTQRFIEDTKAFKDFVAENHSLGRKLIDAFKWVIDKIKSTFSGKAAQDAAAMDALGVSLADAEQALKLWEKAYREAKKAVKKAPVNSSLDGNGEVRYSYNQDLELRGEPKNKPSSQREWSAFNRSFANKTSDLKNGDERIISIFTDSHMYIVSADGYMQGFVEQKVAIENITKLYELVREEFNDGSDYGAEIVSIWSQANEFVRGGQTGSPDLLENRRSTSRNAAISQEERGGGRSESDGRASANYDGEETELVPGSLVIDNTGEAYRVDESGNAVKFSVAGTDDILDENLRRRLQESADKYGVIPPGENPTRAATVPKRTSETKRASMTIRTVLEAGVTPDMMVPAITEEVLNETFSYERKSNKERLSAVLPSWR